MLDISTFMTTIGEIVAADYRTAAVFRRHGVDFCCQGSRTLERGCRDAGIDTAEILRELTRESTGKFFDFFLANPAYVRLGLQSRVNRGAPFDRRILDRWLGLMDGLMKPAQMQGTLKEVDPVCLMVTVDGLVHWHLANDGFYRSVLGRGLDDPEVVRRAREHVTQVVLRTMGLE